MAFPGSVLSPRPQEHKIEHPEEHARGRCAHWPLPAQNQLKAAPARSVE
jgi:hypothetical protein